MPTIRVTNGKPGEKHEPNPGQYQTPYGVMTVTDKGISTTKHPDGAPPFVQMISKRKYRPSLGK